MDRRVGNKQAIFITWYKGISINSTQVGKLAQKREVGTKEGISKLRREVGLKKGKLARKWNLA